MAKKEQYEVLYEDIQSMVKQVSEGHSGLNRKLDTLQQEMRGAREELGHVEKAVIEGNKRLETLINRFEAHEHAHTS